MDVLGQGRRGSPLWCRVVVLLVGLSAADTMVTLVPRKASCGGGGGGDVMMCLVTVLKLIFSVVE